MNKEKLLKLSDTLRGIAEGKEWEYKGIDWFRPIHDITYYLKLNIPIRLKPQPDPYAELKAAHAAGKMIQVASEIGSDCWTDLPDPNFDSDPKLYRIKPESQKLPLSQDDVKAGDEFLYDNYRRVWTLLCQETKLIYFDNGLCRSFEQLMLEEWKIRSIGETEWRDCYKLVEQ